MTGTIFLGGTARRKSSGARSQVCRNVSGPTRPVVSQSLGGHLATSQGYGLGAGASPVFRRSEKSPGRAGEGVGDGRNGCRGSGGLERRARDTPPLPFIAPRLRDNALVEIYGEAMCWPNRRASQAVQNQDCYAAGSKRACDF